ncbi:MAG: sensor histidine kinase [Acidimicrobiia bacterium]
MDVEATESAAQRRSDRPLLATFGVALLLIGTASAIFVGSYSGQRVAGLATRVQIIERALGSADLSRVYVAQGAYISALGDVDGSLDHALAAAAESLADTAAGVDGYLALAAPADAAAIEALATFTDAAETTIEELGAGHSRAAANLIEDAVDPALDSLRTALVDLQRADAAEINQTASALGRVADVVRFLLAFALPAAGITVYRWVMNRQRQRAELRLRIESERAINRSKDEFIANVSHELRTPLTGIIGFAQLLEEANLDPVDLEVVKLIVDQSAELSRMVDDLLTAARADANALTINPRSVCIGDEVAEVVRFVELMRTEVEVSCQEATVLIDPERFRQVLRNLLVNARKHGGTKIKVRGMIRDGRYVCTVIDDGPGVPAHVQERLFSRFVHTGESPVIMGSVGLGLAIVSELCRLMGCEVAYQRVRGETWFSVTMPLGEMAVDLREGFVAAPA